MRIEPVEDGLFSIVVDVPFFGPCTIFGPATLAACTARLRKLLAEIASLPAIDGSDLRDAQRALTKPSATPAPGSA